MTGVGAATLGVGAAVLGAVGAMGIGAIEASKFAKALQLTGNYAAVTEASIADMAQRQKALTGQSIGGARESIETVAGTGRFGPQALEQVARAMGDYQKLTHTSAEDALKVFDSLSDGAAKWAERTNASMHFLTLAQYDQIKAMDEAGDKQGAAAMAAGLLAQTLESRGTPAAGAFARAWDVVTGAVGRAVEAMKAVGRPVDAVAAQLEEVERKQQSIFARQAQERQARATNPDRRADAAGSVEYLQSLDAERARLMHEAFRNGERANDASARATVTQQAIEGRGHVDHAAAAQQSEYTRLIERVNAFNKSTDEQIERQAKLSEGERFAIQMHEALANATGKLSAAQRRTISDMADAAAARETDLEQSNKLKAALKDEADSTLKADAATFASRQANVQAFKRSMQEKVEAINFETSLIGKSADEATRMQQERDLSVAAAQAMQATQGQRINEVLAVELQTRRDLAAATDQQRATQEAYNASFEHGWSQAMQNYVKAASNSAAQGQQVFESAMRASEDAVVQFAETGKWSWKSLTQTVLDSIIRMETQKGLAALIGAADSSSGSGGGSSTAGAIGSALGSIDWSNLGKYFGVSFANGLDYVPYDGFPAILHEGEKVMRRQDAAVDRSSGKGMHFDSSGQTYVIGEGVSRADVHQAVQQGNAQVKAEIARQIRVGRMG
jgi:lambda family phage tail tape measure protein